jgi:hypothetical protein
MNSTSKGSRFSSAIFPPIMKLKLLDHKEINFPSGSGIEYHEEKIYLAGDDSGDLLVMNKNWKELSRVQLVHTQEPRIPKNLKPDLEATAILEINKIPRLLILGSGSLDPHRSKALLINLDDLTKEEFQIDVFYERLKNQDVHDLNIEAASVVLGQLVLAHRGNLSNPENYLVVTNMDVWKNQAEEEIHLRRFELPPSLPGFAGVSGMTYSPKNDWLIITLSTEETKDAVADGKIGTSYLGIIENAARKLFRKKIKVDEVINLSEVDARFAGNKIESVCVQSDKEAKVKLHLVADNDNGKTTLFKVRLKE